jgi:amidase
VLDLAQTLDHVGPMCRCTADAAIMLQVIAGRDPEDQTTMPDGGFGRMWSEIRLFQAASPSLRDLQLCEKHVPEMATHAVSPWRLRLDEPLKEYDPALDAYGHSRVRIGVDEAYNSEGVAEELRTAVEAAVAALASAVGAEVEEVAMPAGLRRCVDAWGTLCSAEAAAAHRAAGTWPKRKKEYGTWFRGWLEHGDTVSGVAYANARHLRDQLAGGIDEVFRPFSCEAGSQHIDVLACPALAGPPPTYHLATGGAVADDACRDPDEAYSWGRFTVPFDFSGHPTLTLPCGLSKPADGCGARPLAFQLVARRGDEEARASSEPAALFALRTSSHLCAVSSSFTSPSLSPPSLRSCSAGWATRTRARSAGSARRCCRPPSSSPMRRAAAGRALRSVHGAARSSAGSTHSARRQLRSSARRAECLITNGGRAPALYTPRVCTACHELS